MKKIYKLLFLFIGLILVPRMQVFAFSYASYLDAPTSDTISGDSLYVDGWIMSDDTKSYLSVYVDGEEVFCNIERYEREDVIKAILGYGGLISNPKPGFKTVVSLDELNLEDGKHKLEIKLFSGIGGLVKTMGTSFNVNNKLAKMYLDYPNTNTVFGDIVLVDGWVMSTVSNGSFKVLLNDVEIPYTIIRTERDDVIKAIKGYGDRNVNSTPGFSVVGDLSSVTEGNYKLKVQYINSNGDVLVSSSKNIVVKKDSAKMYLDTPSSNVNDGLVEISGWVMSTNKNTKLELYVDDELIDIEFNRKKRADVIDAIKGYGDDIINSLPGFYTKIDMSNYLNGKHNIKVVVKNSSDVIISEVKKNINLNKYKSDMYVDKPTSNYQLNGTSLKISGWVMSNIKDKKVMVSIDGDDEIEVVNELKRSDVIKAYPNKYNLSNNEKPGFSIDLDMSSYLNGKHNVYVRVYDEVTGEIVNSRKVVINLNKYQSNMYIDTPVNNYKLDGINLSIEGWALTESLDYSMKLFIDDEEVDTVFSRVERIDVIEYYHDKYDRESNLLSGFKTDVVLDSFKDGEHVISVRLYDNITGELLVKCSERIYLSKYISRAYIDKPGNNQSVNGTYMNVKGWFLTTSSDNYLKFYVDNKEVQADIERVIREDVLDKYGSDYGIDKNSMPGYEGEINLSSYKDGTHKLSVKVYDSKTNELLVNKDSSFKLRKYDGMLIIDYPTKSNYSNNSNLTIQGWELSESENSIVKVFFDNKELDVTRYEREDVISAHPDLYGGSDKNSLPGFTTSMSLNSVGSGDHMITIELYSVYGDLITSTSKRIIIYDKLYFGIDVSSHQGRINWNDVNKDGIDFAIIRLGYGDNYQSQDDVEFWNNIEGCVKNNIPYGVYIYSYATKKNGTSELNKDSVSIDSEVAHTLRVLGSLNSEQKALLKLPVFIDMEDDSTISVGKSGLTELADYYCTNIESNGYECGVYANKNWFTNYLDSNYLGNKYDIWLAHYTGSYDNLTDYSGSYQLWQYTSSGGISGINSSGLDMDVSFKKYW